MDLAQCGVHFAISAQESYTETMSDNVNPPLGELADEHDQLGWDITKHGRMIDHASEEEPVTVEWRDEESPTKRSFRSFLQQKG